MKTIKKSAAFLVSVLGLMSATNQIALAAAKCTVNGREVPCEELGNQIKGILGWGVGSFLVIFALVIWALVFWIMMIVHLTKHKVEDKVVWAILMVFTGIVGALVYYFVVKRKFNKKIPPPTAMK